MPEPLSDIQLYGIGDVGVVRDLQQDAFAICHNLREQHWGGNGLVQSSANHGIVLVVADGMGGMNAGEVASALAVEGVRQYFGGMEKPPQTAQGMKAAMVNAIHHANSAVLAYANENPMSQGMGTTLVLAFLQASHLHIAWVGDSRCYVYGHSRGLLQLSKDHSYVQQLVDEGGITQEQAFYHPQKNIVLQSLGGHKPIEPDYAECLLNAGDMVMLCSDGLNSMLTDCEIANVIGQCDDVKVCAQALVNRANEAGGHDNTTLVLARIGNSLQTVGASKGPVPELGVADIRRKASHVGQPVAKANPMSESKVALGLLAFVLLLLVSVGVGFLFVQKGNTADGPGGLQEIGSGNAAKSEVGQLGAGGVGRKPPGESAPAISRQAGDEPANPGQANGAVAAPAESRETAHQAGQQVLATDTAAHSQPAAGRLGKADTSLLKSYYQLGIATFPDKKDAQNLKKELLEGNLGKNVKILSHDGLYQVVIQRFHTKKEVEEFKSNHPNLGESVVIFQNKEP